MKLFFRGLKLYTKFPKPVLLSRALSSLIASGVPFINIWFSAQIINELAGARNQERLIMLVLLTLGLNFATSFLRQAFQRWRDYCDSQTWRLIWTLYSDKLLELDFIDAENADIQQQAAEIKQHHNGMGFGLGRLIRAYDGMIDGSIRVVLSVAFAFTLFTMPVPEGSPLAFLNSPFAVLVVLLLLAASVLLAPYLTMLGGKIFAEASNENNRGNRLFEFYCYRLLQDDTRAKDVRIYEQHALIDHHIGYDFVASFQRFINYFGKFNTTSICISHLSNMLIYLFVVLKAYAGAFPVGNIIQYVNAITQFGSGFASILTNVGEIANNDPYMKKVFDLLDMPSKMQQGNLTIPSKNECIIEFHDVSFKYPNSDDYALKNLSMKFDIGSKLAVVGMNGSGKTTMIKLLCRLYDPTEGSITLNGVDIKSYDYEAYKQVFGVVFQDFSLLPFTLGQNVATNVEYDEERVRDVLIKSGFEERLAKMPLGLETYVYKNFEENGVDVSGGEAQKIALARALYKDAPFVVLDEPTAALDPIAEYEIYSKFNEIVGGKTAIYISHRLASCRFCDDIVVFDQGMMIQRGNHDQLLTDSEGKYAELWHAQAQYYTDESSVA